MLESHYRYATHAELSGTTQGGKTYKMIYDCREHNLDDSQVFAIDGKGTAFRSMARYYARIPPKRKCLFLDPHSNRSMPLQFFHPKKGVNVSAHSANVVKILLNAVGNETVSELPRLRRVVNMLASYCATSGKPIGHAMEALYFHNRHLARHAADIATNSIVRNNWRSLAETKSQDKYEAQTESTRNRLDPFVSVDSLRRLFGTSGGVSVHDILESGANFWIDLTPTHEFPDEACRIVGGFLVSELKSFSLAHMEEPHKIYCYLDEVELYPSPDLAKLLELSAGSGMRCELIFHHEGQFADPRLIQDIRKNCRIKYIGTGTMMDEAKRHAEQNHFTELSMRKKKDDLYTFVTDHVEMPFETFTESEFGNSTTYGTRMEARLEKVLNGQIDFSPEEKLLHESLRYLTLKERQFRIITPDSDTLFEVPDVIDYLTDTAKVLQFMETDTRPNEDIDAELNKEDHGAAIVIKKPKAAKNP